MTTGINSMSEHHMVITGFCAVFQHIFIYGLSASVKYNSTLPESCAIAPYNHVLLLPVQCRYKQ